MNILVVGGAGYIGSILCRELIQAGHSIHVLDNFRCKQKSLLDLCAYSEFSITFGDCRHAPVLRPLIQKVDCVIWLAAVVGAEACDLESFDAQTTNIGAVRDMLPLMSKNQWILYPCTNSGYGIGQNNLSCTEDTPMKPISLYGKTKTEAETMILQRENAISLRLATVFGSSPCMRTELLVNNFVLRAMRDKSIVLFESHFKRNYIHVRDVAQAFLLGIKQFETMKGSPYNVGLSSANVSKYELCQQIKQHIDFEIIQCDNRKDIDQRNYIVSNEKIEKQGFCPVYTLDRGIIELKKSYTISIESYHGKSFGY